MNDTSFNQDHLQRYYQVLDWERRRIGQSADAEAYLTPMGNLESKSALLGRLKAGKRPLRYPPPLAYSYPWYNAIESATPLTVSDVRLVDDETEGQLVLINQAFWRVVNTLGPEEFELADANWSAVGVRWHLKRETVLAMDSSVHACATFDPAIPRLTTVEHVRLEARYRAQADAADLAKAASSPTDHDDGHGDPSTQNATIQQRLQTEVDRQARERDQTRLAARLAVGLPLLPSADEIDADAARRFEQYFNPDNGFSFIAGDDGLLWVREWRLYRSDTLSDDQRYLSEAELAAMHTKTLRVVMGLVPPLSESL